MLIDFEGKRNGRIVHDRAALRRQGIDLDGDASHDELPVGIVGSNALPVGGGQCGKGFFDLFGAPVARGGVHHF